jgi:flagellar biosynthesis component FlhA
MFCSNCGAKVSSDMLFCPRRGNNLLKQTPPEELADRILGSMSPDEQERFYKDLAEALFAPVRELATHYETIIKDGPITNDDVQQAIKIFQEKKMPQVVIDAVLPIVAVAGISQRLRNLLLRRDISDREMRKIIEHYCAVLTHYDAMDTLLRDIGIKEESISSLLRDAKGLRIWLKETILENLLLVTILYKVKIPQLVYVAALDFFSEVNKERFQAIVDGIKNLMKYVK